MFLVIIVELLKKDVSFMQARMYNKYFELGLVTESMWQNFKCIISLLENGSNLQRFTPPLESDMLSYFCARHLRHHNPLVKQE